MQHLGYSLHDARRVLAFGAFLLLGCSDRFPDSLTGPSQPRFSAAIDKGIEAAIAAQDRHTEALMRNPAVAGTAVGVLSNGQPVIRIFLKREGVSGIPASLDGIPVAAQVTGMFVARSNPTTRARPAPVGFSVGHPLITAGTIGARVLDGSGNVFILSNNHVLANSNNASLGDPAYQPGPFDGGTAADAIGTLHAFRPIKFNGDTNTIDAAIVRSSTSELDNSTPTDDGYGLPNSRIFGDADSDGWFDNRTQLLNRNVQKYGRSTKLTRGRITAINATLDICYEVIFIFCIQSARFVDQLVIEPGSFSAGGDSGSGIVTDDENRNPVGLLFAGSSTQTIANRIDRVLNTFGVRVDGIGGAPPEPPSPVTDIAVTAVSAPASVTYGAAVQVTVTVSNVGNQNVATSFDVSLSDATDGIQVGTQSIAGLAAGAFVNRTFTWNTAAASLGSHTLVGSHSFADDNVANDQKSATVSVSETPVAGSVHVGDLDAITDNSGSGWAATVEVLIHDGNHSPLNGATVRGTWTPTGLASDECTTGELGGNGTCIFLYPSIKKNLKSVKFTVNSVTINGQTYSSSDNHDPEGDSNGTTITVKRP